jgi:hypothetical protein
MARRSGQRPRNYTGIEETGIWRQQTTGSGALFQAMELPLADIASKAARNTAWWKIASVVRAPGLPTRTTL